MKPHCLAAARALALLASITLAAGCRSTFATTTTATNGMLVTQSDVPRPYKVLGHVSAHQSGWYFFALFPVVPIDLQQLVHVTLPKAAAAMGADAVIQLEYEVVPASILNFSPILIPDWSASAVATGMAVKFTEGDPPSR